MSSEVEELRTQIALLRAELARVAETTEQHSQAFDSLENMAVPSAAALPQPEDDSSEVDEDRGAGPDQQIVGPPDLTVLRPWVEDNISNWCERQVTSTGKGQINWCPCWDEHPEAITRLWVLRAVQITAAREGPEAVSVYLRDHFDHHIGILTAPTGPFNRCSPEHASERKYLPTRQYPHAAAS